MNVENRCVEIKAELQKLTDVKNPTARLVAVLMACGITATSELAELVGVGERAIQKARKLLPQANHSSPPEPQFANHSSPPEPQFAENEPQFAPRARTRAQMESPSEISSFEEVASKAREGVGLGDLSEVYADWLAGWLKGDHGIKDLETARAILAGSVDAYGPAKVKAGMLELQARIASGEKFRDLGRMFSSYVKHAKLAKADAPPKKTVSQLLRDRRAAEAAA